MAKRPTTPSELRDAVERTVQSTLDSAERQRDRTVDNLRTAAGASLARGRRALEDARPATHEDLRELKAELRRIGRRLDAIEERLPAKASRAKATRAKASGAKRSSGKRSTSK
jgi:predicted  nucleic acid-binding Zn-ribbon protein